MVVALKAIASLGVCAVAYALATNDSPIATFFVVWFGLAVIWRSQ